MALVPRGPEGIAVVWDRMQLAEYKLRQIYEIVGGADWQGRASNPNLFAQFCAEIDQLINIDGMD